MRVRTCMVACLQVPRRPIGPNSLNSSALRSAGQCPRCREHETAVAESRARTSRVQMVVAGEAHAHCAQTFSPAGAPHSCLRTTCTDPREGLLITPSTARRVLWTRVLPSREWEMLKTLLGAPGALWGTCRARRSGSIWCTHEPPSTCTAITIHSIVFTHMGCQPERLSPCQAAGTTT